MIQFERSKKLFVFRSLVLSLLLLLTGCSTTTYSTVQHADFVSPEEGLAIFRLTSNARSIGQFLYWENVKLENVDTGEKYSIHFSNEGNLQTAVYFGAIPEGNYRLTHFDSRSCGAVCVNSTLYLSEFLGIFEVKAERLTDLGHLIYHQVDHERSLVVRAPQKTPWIKEYISKYYPNIPRAYIEQDFLGWIDSEESLKKQNQVYELILKHATGLSSPQETEDGSILFGTNLGCVRIWIPGQSLRNIPTGIQGAITAVTSINKNMWVIGTEDGQMKITRDAGLTWENKNSPSKHARIVFLHVYAGKLYAVTSNTEKASIYYTEPNSDEWKMISSHTVEFNFWIGGFKNPVTKSYKNKLITYLPGGKILITNMDHLQTQTKETPGTVMDLTLGNDGVIRVKATEVMIVDPYESHDLGDTWVESSQNRLMALPHFIDEKNGFGLERSFSGDLNLFKSIDGGKTWNEEQVFPFDAPAFGYIENSDIVFATDHYNTIVFSRDGGKTWEFVR